MGAGQADGHAADSATARRRDRSLDAQGRAPKTLRARLEQHRSKPGCNQCHGVIDPIGLALENFDAIGRWRDRRRGRQGADRREDDAAERPRSTARSSCARRSSAARDQFVRNFTEKLMMYALGRELEYYDMPQVRASCGGRSAQDLHAVGGSSRASSERRVPQAAHASERIP